MRTLVLQLARFGDIYQTWPTLSAIQRAHPGSELHVLVRQRFAGALKGFGDIVVHTLPTLNILESVYNDGEEGPALARLDEFLEPLHALGFDQIVNLSFSPVSSYLTDILASEKCEVRGYTRHADGYLNIPDDASAYFYAQAEIGGFNRFHITQIFASVAGVDLRQEDFQFVHRAKKNQIVVHMGASQVARVYPAEKWVRALKMVAQSPYEIYLVGGPDEHNLAETVRQRIGAPNVTNLAGQTDWSALIELIADSKLFIGCDSGPAQIPGLTQTPVLHLTSDTANFWTTGPTSGGSRVIYEKNLSQIEPHRIAHEAIGMLRGQEPTQPCAIRADALGEYQLHDLEFDDFSWNLIRALYTGAEYPRTENESDLLAIQRLFEVGELALAQIDDWRNPRGVDQRAEILAQVDLMISEIGKLNPRINPLVQWFETERLRIAPHEDVLKRTRQLFIDLMTISAVYRRFKDPRSESLRAAELCRKCAPAMREFQLKNVQDDFQHLVSTLHELARHSTKVGGSSWSAALSDLNGALERRDLIEVADQLEYVLVPALS